MSADPLAVHVPGGADLNLYAYVSGAVLKAVDPLGLYPVASTTDEFGNEAVEQHDGTVESQSSVDSTSGQEAIWQAEQPSVSASSPEQLKQVVAQKAKERRQEVADYKATYLTEEEWAQQAGKPHYDGVKAVFDWFREVKKVFADPTYLPSGGIVRQDKTQGIINIVEASTVVGALPRKGASKAVGSLVDNVAASGSRTLSRQTVRANYLKTVDEVAALAQRLHQRGSSAESVVRTMAPVRNAVKMNARASGSWVSARWADVRNIIKYGNRAGPSADDLFQRYGSWDKALEAIGRTSSKYNKLVQ